MKKCPYCAEQIQDEAVVCKHCGRDLGAGNKVQTVELTGKRFKGQLIGAGIIAFFGFVIMIGGFSEPTSTGAQIFGAILLTLGVVWFFVARVKIWWHHK